MATPIRSRPNAYRLGVVVAIVTAILTLWTSVVRDDGTGATYIMLIAAVGVGWFAADFQARGMARTLLGVAVMQMINAALLATAPVTAAQSGGWGRVLLCNAAFAALWLVSAALFRSAARARLDTLLSR